jgi:gamma-carbonic anhydrase
LIIAYRDRRPAVDPTAFVAASADVIGWVTVGAEAGIWFNVVLRADHNQIGVGRQANVQDGCVVHCDPPALGGRPVMIGDRVTVGHGVCLHGCTIGDHCLIGMGSILMEGVSIGSHTLVGAGSLLPPGTSVPPRSVVFGSPARVRRRTSDDELRQIEEAADIYIELARRYAAQQSNPQPGLASR